MASDKKQFLVQVDGGTRLAEPIVGSKGDVVFPPEVRGWGDVLDCRHTPYTEKSLQELLHFGHHVHKVYLLVYEDQLKDNALG